MAKRSYFVATGANTGDYTIYGVGLTEASARRDAKEWVDGGDTDALAAQECTKGLYDKVKADGACDYVENAEGLLCTMAEAEAADAA